MAIPIPSFLRAYWKQIAVACLVLAYLFVNATRIGGDAFVQNLNRWLLAPLVLTVAALAISVWRGVAVGTLNRLIWSGLVIGWSLWAIAEVWWATVMVLRQEAPYPSWADLVWLAGYLAMYVALVNRVRSLPHQASRLQRAAMWVSVLLTASVMALLIIISLMWDSDPTNMAANVLNVLYPLADLGLFIMVLRIGLAYQRGLYGRVWIWMSTGFVLMILSDVTFSFTDVAGLYYPDGQVNLQSILVDVPYNLSYACWLIGLIDVRTMRGRHHRISETDTTLPRVPNAHVLVYTKTDDTVIDVSHNYERIFAPATIRGQPLSTVLGLSPADTETLLSEIKAGGILYERSVVLQTRLGQQPVLLSGLASGETRGTYFGASLLLRLFVDDTTLDELLSDNQRSVIQLLLSRTDVREKRDIEIKRLLSGYYAQYIRAFYNMSLSMGGIIVADAFLSELQSVVEQHNWAIDIYPDALDVESLSLPETCQVLPALLDRARHFVTTVLDQSVADAAVQGVRTLYDETTLKNVALWEKAFKMNVILAVTHS